MKNFNKYLTRFIFFPLEAYYHVKGYIFRGEYKRKHFLFQKEGNQIRLVIQDHYDFVVDVHKKIESYKKKHNEKESIKYALNEALKGCLGLYISKGKKSVTFWTKRGKIDYTSENLEGKKNVKLYYQILGLLADMDFVRDSFVPPSITIFRGVKPHTIYRVDSSGKEKVVVAYFNKMVPEATEFALKMFQDVYSTKKEKLKINVG